MPPLKPLLIESWLPIQAIGAESQRERGASSALPPLYFLHVWWARRPLTTSRAAILASVLPQWSADFPPALLEKFPNEENYKQWFTFLIGVRGDPVKGRKLVAWAKDKRIKLDFHPYGGAPRAFTINPAAEDLKTLGDLLEWTLSKRNLSVLDPFAGGESIPFEALRYGFTTYANDLNSVAAVILKSTLDYPARFGSDLTEDIRKWGKELATCIKEKLNPYFPKQKGERFFAYIWARTIACPTTGKPVPLSPNWWLSTSGKPVAVRVIAESYMDVRQFEILTGAKAKTAKPDEGTISRGVARSIWTGETIDGDYIKSEAQAGRMGQMLYAIAVKRTGGTDFRLPNEDDLYAITHAESALASKKSIWIEKDIIPNESIPAGQKTSEPLRYGMYNWQDMLSPRQLLSMGTFVETLREIAIEISSKVDKDKANAIITYLAIALDKCPNYNSRMSVWHPLRSTMANTFNRHDFAFAWSHGEFDSASSLIPWAVEQICDSYNGLAEISAPAQKTLHQTAKINPVEDLRIQQGSAANLFQVSDSSIDNITVDPPYYDNVQYAELSDFFYVWLKRSVGHLYPEYFRDELTNKDDEAVANPARIVSMGKKKKELAEQDYENKMTAAFREMYRVLRPEGSLTVMFTHKKVEAWDTLASALINAGFVIKASWPVLTSEVDPKTGQPKTLRPETALDLAREEVVRLRKQGLLAGRDVRFDPVTDWYLMAWDAFHAEEFPYDEGRKLAIALGVELDRLIMTSKRFVVKKSNSVVLQVPATRAKRDMVDPDLTTFEHWIDAAHTAMLVYEEDGAGACDVFLRKANLKKDNTFKALLQSMINAIPRARIKGKFARPEAETLENIRLAFFPELTVPVEEEPQMPVEKQISMFEESVEVNEDDAEGDEEE
jgi:putative DNA methylase